MNLNRKATSVFMGFVMITALLFSTGAFSNTDLSGSNLTSDQADAVSSRMCPNAKLLSAKLITDICWSCIFPIRLMGITMGGGNVPDGAAKQPLCVCFDNLGVPEPGLTVGYWEPARLVETVRQPGCSPSLNGIVLPGFNPIRQGGEGNPDGSVTELNFHHYHYFAFPLLSMLDLFMPAKCFSDGMLDFDLMYLSEVDPTWNNPSLAFFANPESAAAANIAAQAACPIDAVAATAKASNDFMWWCAGAWGAMYPLSGFNDSRHFTTSTSLSSTRAINALHRRGLAVRTMGDDAMCEERVFEPFMPKTQYRLGMFYPVAQGNSNNHIGESAMTWGWGRMIPGVSGDALYVVWRWNDCCMRY